MSKITKENVYNSLKRVNDPDLHKDLVTLNMIKDVKVAGNTVEVTVELTTPACPLKDKIKDDCIKEIKNDAPEADVKVNLTARVQGKAVSGMESIMPGVKNTIAVASGKGGVK